MVHREAIPESIRVIDQWANNHAEQSYEATRVRERVMSGLASLRLR